MSQERFTAEAEPFRDELRAYCYRMAASAGEADDLVQDTYLRAWRAYPTFERRASMRSWLYKIATNVCLTALDARRRALPSHLADPSDLPPTQITPDITWVEPFARESLRLALIASLQLFPPRQRAIFLLREVMSFSAEETAEALDTTVAAVKSGLQRVRARLDELPAVHEELLAPTDPRARALLDGYIAAFERSDPTLLVEVLRADATLEATPFTAWAKGRTTCIRLLGSILGAPGDWRLEPTVAHHQPAALVSRRDAGGILQPNGIVILAATATRIASVVAFHHAPRLGW